MKRKYLIGSAILILLFFIVGVPSYAEEESENCLSNYGYVPVSSVNFRESPGSDGRRIGIVKEYGLLELLGTHTLNGEIWYHVDFNGKKGYIKGNYVKQLTIKEVTDFINSENFAMGLSNNNIVKWEKEIRITEYSNDQTPISENQISPIVIYQDTKNQDAESRTGTEYSQMTLDNLLSEYNKIRNEVYKRTLTFENGEVMLIERDDITLYLTGAHEVSKTYDGSFIVSFNVVAINNLAFDIQVELAGSVNGWDVSSYSSVKTSATNKSKGIFTFSLTDADISSFEEITDIEFRIHITGIDDFKPIKVSFAAQ